jgi:hypothetical protein
VAGTSSSIVAGLTAAAVGAIGLLAYQASATVPAGPGKVPASASPLAKVPRDRRNPLALPAMSGSGERVVYAMDEDRVWLVSDHNRVLRTFGVRPGSVDPLPGAYVVTSRSNAVTGTDGTPIEHVVRFTSVDGVAIGFSAAVDQNAAQVPDPMVRTGGIRETRADGEAMWMFATIGVPVIVMR